MHFHDNPERLGNHFNLTREMLDEVTVEQSGDSELIIVHCLFDSSISEEDKRADYLEIYRAMLNEIVPILPSKSKNALRFVDDGKTYEMITQEVIEDMLAHAKAIWDGTHPWSDRICSDKDPRPLDFIYPVVSCAKIILKLDRGVENKPGVSSLAFVAFLVDRRLVSDSGYTIIDYEPKSPENK
jgi:hypothetical protein